MKKMLDTYIDMLNDREKTLAFSNWSRDDMNTVNGEIHILTEVVNDLAEILQKKIKVTHHEIWSNNCMDYSYDTYEVEQ